MIGVPTSSTRQFELRGNPDVIWFAYSEVELLSLFYRVPAGVLVGPLPTVYIPAPTRTSARSQRGLEDESKSQDAPSISQTGGDRHMAKNLRTMWC